MGFFFHFRGFALADLTLGILFSRRGGPSATIAS